MLALTHERWLKLPDAYKQTILSDCNEDERSQIISAFAGSQLKDSANKSEPAKPLSAKKISEPAVAELFLQNVAQKKAKSLEKYIDTLMYEGPHPVFSNSNLNRYHELNSFLKDIYQSYGFSRAALLDIPDDLLAEHKEALKQVALESLKNKQHLVLENVKGTDLILNTTCAALKEFNGSHYSLDMRGMEMNDDRLVLLLDSINPEKLVSLDLSQNKIGNKGAQHLADMVQKPNAITENLILNGNDISDIGALVFSDWLGGDRSIKLELQNNPISEAIQKTLNDIADASTALSTFVS